jgi:hypothetical protein
LQRTLIVSILPVVVPVTGRATGGWVDLQEISDRLEIEALVRTYAEAVDEHRYELLDELFTGDAEIDLTEAAGFRANGPGELGAWLSAGAPRDKPFFHLCAGTRVRLRGDVAQATTLCLNPMPSSDTVVLFGHWYDDDLVRTASGWRIRARRLRLCFHAELTGIAGASMWRSPWAPAPPS